MVWWKDDKLMPKHKKRKVPKGYHRMPNAKIMKGTKHKSKKRKY